MISRDRGGGVGGGEIKTKLCSAQCYLWSCQCEGHVETDPNTEFSFDKIILHCKCHNCFNHHNSCRYIVLRRTTDFNSTLFRVRKLLKFYSI